MVEANRPQGDADAARRTVRYGKWREDKTPEAGHSRELFNVATDPEFYDNLEGQPYMTARYSDTTIIQCFKRQV